MPKLTAGDYARLIGRPVRTVQGWLTRGKRDPLTIPGFEKIGTAYVADREVWDRIAAEERRPTGRRDHKPRRKE